jgi:hypothetical protein
MVSNGLSRRRRTLKRPLVCKSERKGECGDCELTAFLSPGPHHVNEPSTLFIELNCDPDPRDSVFELTISGPFTVTVPQPTIVPNIEVAVSLKNPATPGTVTIRVDCINSDACLFRASDGATILP